MARRRPLLALLALCVSACTPSPAPSPPPKVVFQETRRDFGRVEQGTQLAHTYLLRNAGGMPLSIDNVRASCKCTAAVTSGRVIAPGGTGIIEVTFDTTRAFGRRTRTVTVYTNDPVQPVSALTLSGRVDADVAAEPAQLYTGRVRPGQTLNSPVRVVAADAASVATGPIETNGSVIAAALDDAPPGTTERQVRLTVRRAAPLGPFKESVVVHTASRRRPLVTIPITGIVDREAALSAFAEESAR